MSVGVESHRFGVLGASLLIAPQISVKPRKTMCFRGPRWRYETVGFLSKTWGISVRRVDG